MSFYDIIIRLIQIYLKHIAGKKEEEEEEKEENMDSTDKTSCKPEKNILNKESSSKNLLSIKVFRYTGIYQYRK